MDLDVEVGLASKAALAIAERFNVGVSMKVSPDVRNESHHLVQLYLDRVQTGDELKSIYYYLLGYRRRAKENLNA